MCHFRDKLRVYNAIIDRYDLGRFLGKNRDMGRSGDEHDKSRVDPEKIYRFRRYL